MAASKDLGSLDMAVRKAGGVCHFQHFNQFNPFISRTKAPPMGLGARSLVRSDRNRRLGQREEKSGSATRLRLRPQAAAMPPDHAADRCQPAARARKLRYRM